MNFNTKEGCKEYILSQPLLRECKKCEQFGLRSLKNAPNYCLAAFIV